MKIGVNMTLSSRSIDVAVLAQKGDGWTRSVPADARSKHDMLQ